MAACQLRVFKESGAYLYQHLQGHRHPQLKRGAAISSNCALSVLSPSAGKSINLLSFSVSLAFLSGSNKNISLVIG